MPGQSEVRDGPGTEKGTFDMRCASYVSLRKDTGSFVFRWTIPALARQFFGGRTEVKRTLGTDQRRVAIRLARRLSVMLERTINQVMASQLRQQDAPTAALSIKLLERFVDGSIHMEGLELDPEHAEEDRQLLATLLGSVATAKASADQRTLADLVKAYFEDGKRANKWTSKTTQELETIFALMLEILGGGKVLADLSRKDFAYFKEVLGKLPSNRSKNPLYRGKSVLELAAMKIPQDQLLSATTMNKILGWVSSLMEWGQLHGYVSANFAEGLALAKTKRDDEHREPYTDDGARALKEAALGGDHRAPWQKWIPLLLMYQGMRVNEAAQLACADFSEVDGIPVVTITDEDGRRVKTSAARRTIPLHPELVRLGLLDHVDALRKRAIVRVWPELSAGRDGYGQGVSRWFAHYREKIGLGRRDLHSLRHSVATRLREADVPEDVVQDLLGHARGTSESFKRYAKSASVKRLHAALSRLTYEPAKVVPLRVVSGA